MSDLNSWCPLEVLDDNVHDWFTKLVNGRLMPDTTEG